MVAFLLRIGPEEKFFCNQCVFIPYSSCSVMVSSEQALSAIFRKF